MNMGMTSVADRPALPGAVLLNHIPYWTPACLVKQRQAPGLQNLLPVNSVNCNRPVYDKLTPLVYTFLK